MLRFAAFCVAPILLMGCGGSDRADTVAVTGVVTVDGNPIENASVTFTPEAGRSATGTTDSEGKFKLTTYESDDGAIVGKHQISIAFSPSSDDVPSNDPAEMKKAKNKNPIPEKYGSASTSGLAEEVKASGENHFELKL